MGHTFNFSGVVQTPSFSSSSHVLRLIARNWQISPILRIRSARFFTVTTGVDRALTGLSNQTPDQIQANPYPDKQSVDTWINASAFASPTLGTYGSLGRNNLKGPGIFQFDAALSRTFALREGKTLQVRGEAFNVLNHANFNVPVSSLNSGAFGKVQAAGDPRIMQFALKLVF